MLGSWIGLAATAEPGHPYRLPPPGTSPWLDQTFRRISRHTRYDAVEARPGGASAQVPAYLATSECAASAKILPVSDVDLGRTPFLGWSWKIVRGLDVVSERTSSGDDFAARVYVLFAFDPEHASLRERLANRFFSSLLARPMPGAALSYVFASRTAVGTTWPNPSQPSARMVAVRSGSSAAGRPLESQDGWYHESVDVRADYARLVSGDSMPHIVAVAIMTDSDDTCANASALYASFCFAPQSQVGCPSIDDDGRAAMPPSVIAR